MLVHWFNNQYQAKTFWLNACRQMTIWLRNLLSGPRWLLAVPFQFKVVGTWYILLFFFMSLHACSCVESESKIAFMCQVIAIFWQWKNVSSKLSDTCASTIGGGYFILPWRGWVMVIASSGRDVTVVYIGIGREFSL